MAIGETRGLDKQVAEKYSEYSDIYEVDHELYGIVGMDLCSYFSFGFALMPSIEKIPHYSTDMFEALRLEKLIEKQGLLEEYLRALTAEGCERKTATAEQRCRAALKVPYVKFPAPPPDDTPHAEPQAPAPLIEQEVSEEPPKAEEDSVETPEAEEAAPQLPDDWWLTYYLGECVPLVFHDAEGQIIETVEAIWDRDNIFSIDQTPLKVDGVALGDLVEVRWEEGDLTPIFVRVKENFGFKKIKVDLSMLEAKSQSRFVQSLRDTVYDFRLDEKVLIITYYGDPDWLLEKLAGWDVSWKLVGAED